MLCIASLFGCLQSDQVIETGLHLLSWSLHNQKIFQFHEMRSRVSNQWKIKLLLSYGKQSKRLSYFLSNSWFYADDADFFWTCWSWPPGITGPYRRRDAFLTIHSSRQRGKTAIVNDTKWVIQFLVFIRVNFWGGEWKESVSFSLTFILHHSNCPDDYTQSIIFLSHCISYCTTPARIF